MKIATLNINGLENKKARLIDLMNQNEFDILCIQETHIVTKESFNFIEKTTNTFGFISAPDTPNYTRTAIFLGRGLHGFQIKNINIETPSVKYRVLHISIHAITIFHIIYIYAPARKEHKAPFYREFFKYIAKLKNQNLIILGDFNFVEYDEDRFLGSNIQDKTITKMCTFKTLGLIVTFKNLHNTINFTHLKTYAAISNAHLSRVCKRGKLSGSCLSTLYGFGSTQLPIFLSHICVPTFSSQNN